MIDHRKRARRAWPYLARRANSSKDPYTYKELTDKLGLHHRSAAFFLGVIQDYCRNKTWPPLQALVVNKRTRLPGSGYVGSSRTRSAHSKALAKVYRKQWPLKPPKDF